MLPIYAHIRHYFPNRLLNLDSVGHFASAKDEGYAMLCYAMLCYAMLCYAMLCYAMLCYAMLCYAMLCYAMLRYALPLLMPLFMLCYPDMSQPGARVDRKPESLPV
jgi:hypothetical protein